LILRTRRQVGRQSLIYVGLAPFVVIATTFPIYREVPRPAYPA